MDTAKDETKRKFLQTLIGVMIAGGITGLVIITLPYILDPFGFVLVDVLTGNNTKTGGIIGTAFLTGLALMAIQALTFIPLGLLGGLILQRITHASNRLSLFSCIAGSAIANQISVFFLSRTVESFFALFLSVVLLSIASIMTTYLLFSLVGAKKPLFLIVFGILIPVVALALTPWILQQSENREAVQLKQTIDENHTFALYLPKYAIPGYEVVSAESETSYMSRELDAYAYKVVYSTSPDWRSEGYLYNSYTLTQYDAKSAGFQPPNNCAGPEEARTDDVVGAKKILKPCEIYLKTKQCDVYRLTSMTNNNLYCKKDNTVVELIVNPGTSFNSDKVQTIPLQITYEHIENIFGSLAPTSREQIELSIPN